MDRTNENETEFIYNKCWLKRFKKSRQMIFYVNIRQKQYISINCVSRGAMWYLDLDIKSILASQLLPMFLSPKLQFSPSLKSISKSYICQKLWYYLRGNNILFYTVNVLKPIVWIFSLKRCLMRLLDSLMFLFINTS